MVALVTPALDLREIAAIDADHTGKPRLSHAGLAIIG
jgi:hypothetical protein